MKIGPFYVGLRKSAADPLSLWKEIYGGKLSYSGKAITLDMAIQVATWFAACRVIASGIAQVSLKVFQATGDDHGEATTISTARDHPLFEILNLIPNDLQTSFEWRETLGLHLACMNNAYCFRNYGALGSRSGQLVELIPIPPNFVTVEETNEGEPKYKVRGALTGATRDVPRALIWHIRGPSWRNFVGMPAIEIGRNAIGLSTNIEESQAKLYSKGVQASGAYSIEGPLNDKQYKDLKKWITEEFSGAENAGVPMILDRGAKWLQTSLTGKDSQTLEQRKYQAEEMCRVLGVMPIMVGISDKAQTYASAEQMYLAHAKYTMIPWYRRIEQSIDKNLLSKRDREKGFYSKFAADELLAGDMETTATYLQTLVLGGILTRNEARRMLNRNPIDGLDEPLTPTNTTPGTDPDPNATPKPNPDDPDDEEEEPA